MTDEGIQGAPMPEAEVAHAMQGVAFAARTMWRELLTAGFTEAQTMKLVGAWMHGSAGGKLEQ